VTNLLSKTQKIINKIKTRNQKSEIGETENFGFPTIDKTQNSLISEIMKKS
jgi:hypothetical protein